MSQVSYEEKPSRSMDELLGETEVGSFIGQHKNLTSIIVGIVILALAVFGGWSWWSDKVNKDNSAKIFQISENQIKSFQDKKIDEKLFTSQLMTELKSLGRYDAGISLVYTAASLLIERQNTQSAIELLTFAKDQYSGNKLANIFISLKLSTLLEDSDKFKEAIDVLEPIAQNGNKVLLDRVYFDLGRFYSKLGNKDKANFCFKYLSEKMPDSELNNLVKFYTK